MSRANRQTRAGVYGLIDRAPEPPPSWCGETSFSTVVIDSLLQYHVLCRRPRLLLTLSCRFRRLSEAVSLGDHYQNCSRLEKASLNDSERDAPIRLQTWLLARDHSGNPDRLHHYPPVRDGHPERDHCLEFPIPMMSTLAHSIDGGDLLKLSSTTGTWRITTTTTLAWMECIECMLLFPSHLQLHPQ